MSTWKIRMSEKDNTKTPSKITLKRKTHTELKVETAPGQARTVPVEVRRKRTYVKQKVEDSVVTPEEMDLSVAADESVAPAVTTPEALPVDTNEPKETVVKEAATAPEPIDKVQMEAKRKAEQEAKRLDAEKAQQVRQNAAKERAERELEVKKEAEKAKKEQRDRAQQEEIARLNRMASATEKPVSKVAIQFQTQEEEAPAPEPVVEKPKPKPRVAAKDSPRPVKRTAPAAPSAAPAGVPPAAGTAPA